MDISTWVPLLLLASSYIVGALSLIFAPAFLRRIIAAAALIGTAFAAGLMFGLKPDGLSAAVSLMVGFQILNFLRIVENRLHLDNLRSRAIKAWFVFSSLSLLLSAAWVYGYYPSTAVLAAVLASVCLLSAFIALLTTLKTLSQGKLRSGRHFSDTELPTVSVLIPARNEDETLTDSIRSILDSDYPKLEIIVLDDCSQDSSSDIIKRFAHQGVRFIKGEAPKAKWLAKNQAYESLAAAASGDWLIFSGVDVRFSNDTARVLTSLMLDRNLKMASVLPERSTAKQLHMLTPLRYLWETSLPRFLKAHKHPGVLSTFWVVNASMFRGSGGFSAVSGSVSPEGFFAKIAGGNYRFLICGDGLRVSTGKKLSDQYETAVRTLYPELRRRLERSFLSFLGLILLIFGPFALFVYAFYANLPVQAVMFAASSLLLLISHGLVSWHAGQVGMLRLVALPLLALQEAVLLLVSTYKYEFGEVAWKGRNICYPVMRVVPHLPNIDSPAKRRTS